MTLFTPGPPPPPPHSVLFRVRICLFPPFESTPYLRTDNISEPPFRGLFAGFSCLGDPPKSKTLLNVPPIFYFITPFLISQASKEREKEKPPPFKKKSPGEKSNTPLFYNSRAGLCRTKSTPLPEILGTRMRSLRPRSGGPGIYNTFQHYISLHFLYAIVHTELCARESSSFCDFWKITSCYFTIFFSFWLKQT